MPYKCDKLIYIDGLQNLNTKDCTNFSNMFNGCTSLCDINSLENWDVSNSDSFSYTFYGYSSLPNIESLEKWNVSKCKNFSYRFHGLELNMRMIIQRSREEPPRARENSIKIFEDYEKITRQVHLKT